VLDALGAGTYVITLLTGDRVTLDAGGGGRFAVSVDPAPRADGSTPIIEVSANQPDRSDGSDAGGGLYVLPHDVLEPIASGRLDRELFNVEYLAASGYHDAATTRLPVIVEYSARPGVAALPAAAALPASDVTANLESIGGVALGVDKGMAADFWTAFTTTSTAGPAARSELAGGIERIWLDRLVRAGLDESVPQIGAPAAWAAGFDGTGIDVAVLDTGIDASHPDVAGKIVASRSFVPGQDVADGHGHGTHVASIVAGTGAASGGQYRGTAPGARLVVGKVLNNAGTGPESQLIDGMEWAALEADAEIVNLSLGSVPTDGTDPASQAVDELTSTTGTLFVIASGNTGPGRFTATSPSTASAALTVGAVDKSDILAAFSSRGPRLGDHAIKPEISGPGVNITAARAAGTRRGVPVDDFHTTLSGTSMAAPHVAGGAAILAQQHPDWSAERLKAALVATAADGGFGVYEQGSGRVDVARAVRQEVEVSPATADFGLLPESPPAGVMNRTLTYSNATADALELDLLATLEALDGGPVPAGTLTVTPTTLTVPAGGTASAEVTLDPAGLAPGLHSGAVVATGAGDVRLRTPVGLAVGEQINPVRVDITPRAAVADFRVTGLLFFGVEGGLVGETLSCGTTTCPQPLEFLLPNGTYFVRALASWNDTAGRIQRAVLIDPEFTVTDNTVVALDANAAQKITIDTERESGVLAASPFSTYRSSTDGAFSHINIISAGTGFADWWATPTQAVTKGDFRVASHWLLGPAPVPGTPLPYVYQLKLIEDGRVPDSLAYRFADAELATVDDHYHADQAATPFSQRWFTWAPWEFAVGGVSLNVVGQTSMREYVLPISAATVHERNVDQTGPTPADEAMAVYSGPSRSDIHWYNRPNAPGAVVLPPEIRTVGLLPPLWWWVCSACRQGDTFYPFMHETSAGDTNTLGQFGRPFGFGTVRLFRDGVEVPQAPPFIGAFTAYDLPAESGRYRLTLDHGATHTEWEFTSSEVTADETPPGHRCVETVFEASTTPCRAEPLLFLRYETGVGLDNAVSAPGGHRFHVTAYTQGSTEPPALAGLEVSISTDDGATWQPVRLRPQGEGLYAATMQYPPVEATTGRVSIRAEAWDADGNRVEQLIPSAFGLRPRMRPSATGGPGVPSPA
jgi:subtilisin family serine protease